MLDRLKEKADELGIKYRSDIKESALIAKIEAFVPPPVKEPEQPKYNTYKNTTDINLFTEDGRCAPNGTVNLTTEEAEAYKGLEICRT